MRRYFCIIGLLAVMFTPQILLSQSKEMTSGKLYLRQEEIDKAIYWFGEAIKIKPENPEAHFLLGKALGQKGRLVEMAKEFETSLSLSNKYAKDIAQMRTYYYAETFNTGVKYAQASDWQKAGDAFSTALAIDATQPEAYKNLAYVYLQTQNDSLAMTIYEDLLKIKPGDLDALTALADLHAARREYEAAIQHYNNVLAIDSTNVRATHGMALCYDYLGQRDNAMSAYERALRAKPDDKDLRFNYGRLYYLREEHEKAIEQFIMVLAADPNDFEANMNVGIAYLKMGEKSDKAISDLEAKGVKITKEEARQVESLKAKQKEIFAKAIPYLEKAAIEIAPTNSSAWFNLGVAYIRVGDTQKGQEAVKKSEELAGK